jgi:succinate dehydrogenase / fumarate reductase cytochrome b subunit
LLNQLFRDDFLWRRFHSLMGVVPLGLFIAEHFWTNAHALNGPHAYESAVETLQGLPMLPLLEMAIIGPLYFHAIYGLYRIAKSRSNVSSSPYPRNWMYALQRWTGVLVLIFVTVHLWQFRFGTGWRFSVVRDVLVQPVWLGAYVACVLATVFHFANGMWNFGVTWGITVGPRSQMISSYVWIGVGIVLGLYGLGSLRGFLM